MSGKKRSRQQARPEPIPPGATRRASEHDLRPGEPPSPLGDPTAAGTPLGGTEFGGLGGSNAGDGSPDEGELEQAMGSGIHPPEAEGNAPCGGPSGGAVGGTPAQGRASGGRIHGGLSPGESERGDTTIGVDPDKPAA